MRENRLKLLRRRAALLAERLPAAVVLGVATVLLPKAQPDEHWSKPPAIEIVADYDQAARSGEGTGQGLSED